MLTLQSLAVTYYAELAALCILAYVGWATVPRLEVHLALSRPRGTQSTEKKIETGCSQKPTSTSAKNGYVGEFSNTTKGWLYDLFKKWVAAPTDIGSCKLIFLIEKEGIGTEPQK